MNNWLIRKAKGAWKRLRYNLHYLWKEWTEKDNWGVSTEKRDPEIIVSLTSFPARIRIVQHAIITLLNQTMRPDRIILWLAEEQFPQKERSLPKKLLKLRDYGLAIKWCSEDIRSYKKLIPSLKEYPNAIVVTIDDDMYYKPELIETLYAAFKNDPTCIHNINTTKMIIQSDEIVLDESGDKRYGNASFLNKLLGGAGCLFPPDCLHIEVFNKATFLALAPTSDDIWFWLMAVYKGTKINHVGTSPHEYEYIGFSQWGPCLWKVNDRGEKLFYRALYMLLDHYPEINRKLHDSGVVIHHSITKTDLHVKK